MICAAFALPGDQRVPRNSDPSSESLSNSSDWNGLSAPPANGNNTSDSLSQDDDLGQCLQRVFLGVVTIVQLFISSKKHFYNLLHCFFLILVCY